MNFSALLLDALRFSMRFALSDLPAYAHILCIGLRTGTELLELARVYPDWKFTVVATSAAMLDVCRTRVAERGISSRCTFHPCALDPLPDAVAYDAATALMVSHSFKERAARIGFLAEIAARLKAGALLRRPVTSHSA